MKTPIVALAIGILTASSPASADKPKLVEAFDTMNIACRGGLGDRTEQACKDRETISKLLEKQGYCFHNPFGEAYVWTRCR